MVEMGKKKNLLKVQEEMHKLQLLMLEFDDIKFKRDQLFIVILKKLGKISKMDLVKKLEEDRNNFYELKGANWTTEKSLEWLMVWFDEIAKAVK